MAADVKAAEFAAQLRNHSFVQNAKSAATLLGRAPGSTLTIAELRTLLSQTAASASVLDMTGMTVTIDDQVTLQDHPGILGGTFIVSSSTQRAGLLLRNNARRDESQMTFILGATFLVHAQHSSQAAVIYALDGRHVLIDECKILGVKLGRAIYVRGTTAIARSSPSTYPVTTMNTAAIAYTTLKKPAFLEAGCCDVHVLRTQIHMNSQDGEAITFEAGRSFAPQSSAREAWLARNATAIITAPVSICIVAECDISGGHYGVAAYGADRIWVGGCRLYRQVRCTSAQDTTAGFLTYGCDTIDPRSTMHHNAYGAVNCGYAFTQGDTGRSKGEGLLQAYVRCPGIQFMNCTVNAHSQTAALYAIYSGPASNVVAGKLTVHGEYKKQFTRGLAVVEADWIDNSKSPQSRTYGGTNGELNNFLRSDAAASLSVRDIVVDHDPNAGYPIGAFAVINPTPTVYTKKYTDARMTVPANRLNWCLGYSNSGGVSVEGFAPGRKPNQYVTYNQLKILPV
jgi:hypothetical protein|nr:MAG TPA: hypothetical protein [Caudoviricetes sp.]